MTTIKSVATGTIYKLPYEITYEVMGDCYIKTTDEDNLDGIDARMENEDEILWFARLYEVMERIDNATSEASDEIVMAVNDAQYLGDWEDIQRAQCEILGLDYKAICAEVDLEEYEAC